MSSDILKLVTSLESWSPTALKVSSRPGADNPPSSCSMHCCCFLRPSGDYLLFDNPHQGRHPLPLFQRYTAIFSHLPFHPPYFTSAHFPLPVLGVNYAVLNSVASFTQHEKVFNDGVIPGCSIKCVVDLKFPRSAALFTDVLGNTHSGLPKIFPMVRRSVFCVSGLAF